MPVSRGSVISVPRVCVTPSSSSDAEGDVGDPVAVCFASGVAVLGEITPFCAPRGDLGLVAPNGGGGRGLVALMIPVEGGAARIGMSFGFEAEREEIPAGWDVCKGTRFGDSGSDELELDDDDDFFGFCRQNEFEGDRLFFGVDGSDRRSSV